jgi:hypothetical protein
MWRGKARYRPHLTDMQEPSGVEKRDMTITNNTPREALWTRGSLFIYGREGFDISIAFIFWIVIIHQHARFKDFIEPNSSFSFHSYLHLVQIISCPMCSLGEAKQDTAHILHTCKNHQALRKEI